MTGSLRTLNNYMENIIENNIFKNAQKLVQNPYDFSPSYNELRKFALAEVEKNKLPTKKDEKWPYTNIQKDLSFHFVDKIGLPKTLNEYILDNQALLIFNNGHFNRNDSVMPDGITKMSPYLTKDFHDSFDALNLACAFDAITFNIKKGTKLKNKLTVLHLVDEAGVNKINSPRIHFHCEENSELTVVEVFSSMQNELFQYSTNAHTSFECKQNSHIKHIKIVNEAKNSTHIGLTKAQVFKDASFTSFVFDFGLKLSRNNVEIHLNENNSSTHSYGIYHLKKQEHSDQFTEIFHHAPHTFSNQLYKGIINDESHGVFTGKINIDENAIGVNSNQLNQNLLLSKKAHVNTRPWLLVNADDVKCSHGATIGELNKEEEFYLESRGISKEKAKKMLMMGFIYEVLIQLNDEVLLKFVNSFFEKVEY
jgi:Fe-S cluster assembly protein SufD